MPKKKKKKLTKLQQEYRNVKDVKAYLRQKSEAQGVYGIKDDSFGPKFFIWLAIIIAVVTILYFTDSSNVDECATGGMFPNFKLCHCYTDQEIANNPKIYENCFGR